MRGSTESASAPLTEADWTDPAYPKLTPYARSKTIAERAAWDLVRERGRRRSWRCQPRRHSWSCPCRVPDLLVRGMALFDPGARSVVGQLGQRVELSSAKARALGWEPRPVEETIADCGRSLTG